MGSQSLVLPSLGQSVPEAIDLAATREDLQPFNEVIKDKEKLEGLFTLYRDRDTGEVLLEITPTQFNRNFLAVMTLEAGVGEWGLFRGMPINDFAFQFRRVNDKVHLVVPNVNFRTTGLDPQQRSVDRSFSDSVLYALPIQSIHSQRQSVLVHLEDLLLEERNLSNVADQFFWVLSKGYQFDDGLSYVDTVKAFPLNVEIQTVYGFSAAGQPDELPPLDTLPDPRGFRLSVRYSFSELPTENGYRPRLADDRIGYFVTAYQDFSNPRNRDLFVRYINRWQLEPQNPQALPSPPKQPIVFWIENTVPEQYRAAIRDGILVWNTAFAQAGFTDAIQVKQMPDDADWDPADVRYNTIRWSNSFQSGLLGIGPSRVNPLTGQILDADVMLDANAVRVIEKTQGFLAENQPALDVSLSNLPLCSQGVRSLYLQWLAVRNGEPLESVRNTLMAGLSVPKQLAEQELCYGTEASRQMAMGGLSLATLQNVLPSGEEMQQFVRQFLISLTAHEVGHTLGLRHNFRGSTMLPLTSLNDSGITQDQGLTGSVMDYLPVNLAPVGSPQGDFFPETLGPYDKWAIEYGYKPFNAAHPRQELRDLEQIAQRIAEPGLSYATDEDAIDPLDPEANFWDLSADGLSYAQLQLDNARVVWERLAQRYPLPGESYSELRERFNTVFYYYLNHAMHLTRYVGGRVFNRDRKGDPGARPPFAVVSLEQQLQSLQLINDYVFADSAFSFAPELVNQLAPSRWMHWGSMPEIFALDYPLYDNILFMQSIVLSELLSTDRLSRLRDAELRSQPGETLTIPRLFDALQSSIWQEVMADAEITTISSLRRGLQRQYLEALIGMTLRNTNALENATSFTQFVVAVQTLGAPEDARVMARYHLQELQSQMKRSLRRHGRDMDIATQAHLQEASDRITKVLEAEIQSN